MCQTSPFQNRSVLIYNWLASNWLLGLFEVWYNFKGSVLISVSGRSDIQQWWYKDQPWWEGAHAIGSINGIYPCLHVYSVHEPLKEMGWSRTKADWHELAKSSSLLLSSTVAINISAQFFLFLFLLLNLDS